MASCELMSIPFTPENYNLAWNHLCDRFNNEALLISKHIRSLVNLTIIQRELIQEFNNLISEANKHIFHRRILDPTSEFKGSI